jgi:hypothetical protein
MCATPLKRLSDETLWTNAPFGKVRMRGESGFRRIRECPEKKVPSLNWRGFYADREVFGRAHSASRNQHIQDGNAMAHAWASG